MPDMKDWATAPRHGERTHQHTTGCINTYPDCDYPDEPHSIEVPCSIIECDNATDRPGQPCDPCYREIGVGA